jgi:NADH:ubiquinone oxidoreductase subunit 5 (subunit L)/multisubunit Na+/H+ antiporter MnhA subunit
MFMAGLGANFEYDLKKIIALSTLSQLGYRLGYISLLFQLRILYCTTGCTRHIRDTLIVSYNIFYGT